MKQHDIVGEEQDMEERQRPPITTERIAQKTAEWEGRLEREPNNKELKKAIKKMKKTTFHVVRNTIISYVCVENEIAILRRILMRPLCA